MRHTRLLFVVLLVALVVPAVGAGAAPKADPSCDFNGDGYGDLIWGNPQATVGGKANAGEVSIAYSNAAGFPGAYSEVWNQDSPGVQGKAQSGDDFGSSSTCGDFDNDGYDDLAVGARFEDVDGIDAAGAVNVIYGSSSGLNAGHDDYWHQNKPGVKNEAGELDFFGSDVAAGDFNGDGYDDLVVGAWQDYPVFNGSFWGSAGAVNVIYGSAAGLDPAKDDFWTQDKAGVKDSSEIDDRFGEKVDVGDFNGDGFDDLIIGAPGEGVGGEDDAGAVNVIYGSASGLDASKDDFWHQNKKGIKESAGSGDQFGRNTTVGDFDGDGRDDLAVGMNWEDRGGRADDGVVQVIYGTATGLKASTDELWHQDRAGVKNEAESGDWFGYSVVSGDFDNDGFDDLAAGVPFEDFDGIVDAGAVNVIYGSASGLSAGHDDFWHQNKSGIMSKAKAGEVFGIGSVARDFNGDGYIDTVIAVGDSCGGNLLFGAAGGLSSVGDQCVGP